MGDRLTEIWMAQAEQQQQLGLDPRHMSDVDRRRYTSDLALQMHEEVSELARLMPSYKRHLLADGAADRQEVAEEVTDCLKVLMTIAQLNDLSVADIVDAFHRKTRVVKSKAEGERMRLQRDTRLICVDMDDVISDLTKWIATLAEARGAAPAGKHTWDMLEAHKDDFYRSGRFREMPPVEGAPEGMRALKGMGYKLVIVTARPQWQYRRLYADTLEWLDQYGVPHDHVLFNKDKVEAVHQHLAPAWPLAFIEDHSRNAASLVEAGIEVLLLDKPHNQDALANSKLRRVASWDEIVSIMSISRKAS